jgi:hypothetical protein
LQGFCLEVVFENEGKWHSLKVTGKDCVDLAEEGSTKGMREREQESIIVCLCKERKGLHEVE